MNANELIEAYLKLEAEADKDTGNEGDECYAMGQRDGFHDAVQLFDLATGGDGEFFGSTEPGCTVDVPVMAERIVERLSAAQARIAELEAQQTWQPIESAPAETDVIVAVARPCSPYAWVAYRVDDAWYLSGDENELVTSMAFTHWMPLPAPPALTGEQR